MSSLIQARGLSKVFRMPDKEPGFAGALRHLVRRKFVEKVAVDHIDLTVEAGEAVAYVGANGAGKSTTVKLLSGILVPSSGDVRIGGLVPHRDRMLVAPKIGLLFGQRTQLWWDLTVADSLAILRDIYQIDAATYRRRLARFDEVLNLGELLPVVVQRLSLGQRVRADLAAALLHAPAVAYLDEPTIGLDLAVKDRVREFLRTISAEGTTLMLTSHDLQDIEGVCGRLVIIDGGRIIFDGAPDRLKDTYARDRILRLEVGPGTDPGVISRRLPDASVRAGEKAGQIEIRFDRFTTTASRVVREVAAGVEIIDFQLDEPKIEDIVRSVYSGRLTVQTERTA